MLPFKRKVTSISPIILLLLKFTQVEEKLFYFKKKKRTLLKYFKPLVAFLPSAVQWLLT